MKLRLPKYLIYCIISVTSLKQIIDQCIYEMNMLKIKEHCFGSVEFYAYHGMAI